jgi:hypothetical protein
MSTLLYTTPIPFGARTKLALVLTVSILLFENCIFEVGSPVFQTFEKFKLTSLNAVRNGSPVPSLAAAPMLIVI